MAGIARPHTVLGYTSPVQYVDTDTKLSDDLVAAPGFRKTLAEFYPKASAADKARCIELLTSLDIGDELKRAAKDYPPAEPRPHCPNSFVPAEKPPPRPKSAYSTMYPSSSDRVGPRADVRNPYTTSYERDYPLKASSPTHADRPPTMAGRAYQATHELSGPVGGTTYQHEYHGMNKHIINKQKPAVPARTGTSSGDRRNNPHPLESFIVWKLPRKVTRDGGHGSFGSHLTDEIMDKVCRGQLTSTYQSDYLGMPQGYPVDHIFEIHAPDWKTQVPYTLDSSMRKSYQNPSQRPELRGNTNRYGCNKAKHVPANGIAPTVPRRHMMHLKSRTTYDREYVDPVGPAPAQVRDMGKEYGAVALHNYLPKANVDVQRDIHDMLDTMNLSNNAAFAPASIPSTPSTPLAVPAKSPPRTPSTPLHVAPHVPASSRGSSSRGSTSRPRVRFMRPSVCPTTQITSPIPHFQPGMTGYQAVY